jgi:hypothetical protein
MRKVYAVSFLLALLHASAAGQTAASPSPAGTTPSAQTAPHTGAQKFHLGGVTVVLPAPEGFEEITTQFEVFRQVFTAVEDPGNELLALHVPSQIAEGMRRGEKPKLTFYTKVAIPRMGKEKEIDADFFAELVGLLEKQGAKIFDPGDPSVKRSLKALEAEIKSRSGTSAEISLTRPQLLGVVEKAPDVYTTLLLTKVSFKVGDKTEEMPMLSTSSFVRVKSRLLFAVAYRKFDSDDDAALISDFGRKWTQRILAANRPGNRD